MSQAEINLQIVVPTQNRYLNLVGSIAELLIRKLEGHQGCGESLACDLNLVLTEGVANAIRHAGPARPTETVRVHLDIEGDNLRVRIFDHGPGFDLEQVPAPDFDGQEESGRGLFLIRALMDSVDYRKTEAGNVLEMWKKLS